MCVVRKAKRLINGFHLGQENSLLTPALSSPLRRESVCIFMCTCMHACVCVCVCVRVKGGMEVRWKDKKEKPNKQIANLEHHPDSSQNEGS